MIDRFFSDMIRKHIGSWLLYHYSKPVTLLYRVRTLFYLMSGMISAHKRSETSAFQGRMKKIGPLWLHKELFSTKNKKRSFFVSKQQACGQLLQKQYQLRSFYYKGMERAVEKKNTWTFKCKSSIERIINKSATDIMSCPNWKGYSSGNKSKNCNEPKTD